LPGTLIQLWGKIRGIAERSDPFSMAFIESPPSFKAYLVILSVDSRKALISKEPPGL